MSARTSRPTWVEGAAGSGFDVDHLPYGVFARSGERPRVAVRIGDQVLDLSVVAAADMVDTARAVRPAHPQPVHGGRAGGLGRPPGRG